MKKKNKIIIQGARENNLKNINLEIPRDQFVVITGLSGSGKSSLAFDTIYAEGQRRYVESLSAYARQFLGNIEKPDVDLIEGLSPAISINQKTTSKNPRSTVATVTEIYDYLRLLYARIGEIYCPNHHEKIESSSISQIVDSIMEMPERSRIQIVSPIVKEKKGTHKKLIDKLIKEGYIRFKIDNDLYEVGDIPELDKNKKHSISVIIDRIVIKEGIETRLADSLETSLNLSNNDLVEIDDVKENKTQLFSTKYSCKHCDFTLGDLEPRIFSFNNPQGACPDCDGLGMHETVDVNKIIQKDLSINDGAIIVYNNATSTYYPSLIKCVCEHFKIDMNLPFKELSKEKQDTILYGNKNEEIKHTYINDDGVQRTRFVYFEGVANNIFRRYKSGMTKATREAMSKYIKEDLCNSCKGQRLKPEILSVYVAGKNIADICEMSIQDSYKFFNEIQLSEKDYTIAKLVLKEIKSRLQFLNDVGLDYLTLDRASGTLSGGEAQRIRLATQIGSKLMGVTYILDEPSIGLHQRDNEKLINTMLSMRDLGNTILVVEHDEETMLACDFIIDIGPKAGEQGGEVVAVGTPKEVMKKKKSITGAYLSGRKKIEVPTVRREGNGNFIEINRAKKNNLKDISVKFPLGKFIGVTGVSGSGKSTLLHLIPRYFDATEGQITVDGTNIKDISLSKLRDMLGFVPQKGVLFSGTIASNIKFGDENISDEDMYKAAEIAQALEFIEGKEDKFDSEISQGGSNVSGGQKQRLSIARALAKKPKILLFDDSFSALDYKTDVKLRKTLREKMQDTTTIIVAQRIATILNVDKIIVMNEGKVVGIGKHQELLKTCPTYLEIAESQLSEEELAKGGKHNE